MNRSTMRDILRRRLQDKNADEWTNGQLDDLLNVGLHKTQREIMKLDPEAFLWVDKADIVVSQELYAWPTSRWFEVEVGKLDSASGTYTPLKRLDWRQTRGRSTGSDLKYARHGRHFALSPIPTESQANGVQIRYVPVLEMGADADVPAIPLALHMGIIVWAQRVTIPETGESDAAIRQELADIFADLSTYYLQTGADPLMVEVDMDKGY